eukprot:3709842-Pyramimonas_sp.AAC.2
MTGGLGMAEPGTPASPPGWVGPTSRKVEFVMPGQVLVGEGMEMPTSGRFFAGYACRVTRPTLGHFYKPQ